jgi:hypothetical protein
MWHPVFYILFVVSAQPQAFYSEKGYESMGECVKVMKTAINESSLFARQNGGKIVALGCEHVEHD